MTLTKQMGIEFIVAFLLIVIFILYIMRIKKNANDAGKLEQWVENLRQQQKTIARADEAKREFGTDIEALEQDDNIQFRKDTNYKYVRPETYPIERDCPECVQFGESPFRTNR